MEFQCQAVSKKKIKNFVFLFYRIAGKSTDELYVKSVFPGNSASIHSLIEVAFPSLNIINCPGTIDTGTNRNMVFCKYFGHFGRHLPEVCLNGKRR